jgi:quercetin dioxygenase-like cupin family protein
MQLWFLDTLVTFPVAHADGRDGISVMDSRARRGDSPPYHVHRTEDEAFHVLEGELVALVDGTMRRAGAGDSVLLPKGVPHTYCVVSEEARWLVVTTGGDFERFVRAAARPAQGDGLPAESGPPTPEQQAALGQLAQRHGIELLGPPLSAEAAEAA